MTARKALSARIFRALLSLYPGGFRDEYGRELELLFADRYRDAETIGARSRTWIECIAGLAVEAPREHGRAVFQDLRYAARSLRQRPMFATTIILTLALGIGANTAIFSVLNAVALRSLPLSHPDELYSLNIQSRQSGPSRVSWPMFERLRASVRFGSLAAMTRVVQFHARPLGASEWEPAQVQLVSGEFFGALKAPVAMGRPLTPEDSRTPGAHAVAVISYAYWQRRFGGSADVLGKDLTLNRVLFKIVGVGADGFSGVWVEFPVDVWIPVAMQHVVRHTNGYDSYNSQTKEPWMPQGSIAWLTVFLRTENAARDAAALNHAFRLGVSNQAESISDPDARKVFLDRHLTLERTGTGFSRLRGRFLRPLYILMAMAGVVLLIACANAANLLLARAASRQREMALRLSLGAGRLRLVQQLLTESVLLVTLAGMGALAISHWAGPLLVQMAIAPLEGRLPLQVETDGQVLAFTMALALTTTLLFGIAPALSSTRANLGDALKAGSRSVISGGSHARALVVLQVAFSVTLVSAAGLLVRSFRNLTGVELGFDHSHVLTGDITAGLTGSGPTVLRQVLDRMRAVPGVQSAALATCAVARECETFTGGGMYVEGYESTAGEQVSFLMNRVSPDYFKTMNMKLTEGRAFEWRDRESSPAVVIVNESLARQYFARSRALGHRVGRKNEPDTVIVGVVRDARVLNPRTKPIPMVYYPLAQRTESMPSVIEVRTEDNARQHIEAVRRAIFQAAPDLPLGRLRTLSDQVDATLGQERLILALSFVFGALALGLAGFGLFGILSVSVARRIPEFGIRIALGAPSGQVLWTVCREAFVLGMAGIGLGLPAMWFGAAAMGTLLFGVSPHDFGTFAAASTILLATAMGASWYPAYRASRVDPMAALRME